MRRSIALGSLLKFGYATPLRPIRHLSFQYRALELLIISADDRFLQAPLGVDRTRWLPALPQSFSTSLESSAASLAVTRASATASVIAAIAIAASLALRIAGSLNRNGRSWRGGIIRSRHNRKAIMSPCLAFSMMVRTIVSASPSSSCSARIVARWRAPLGLPAGLPDRPGGNGRPGPRLGCFPAAFSAMALRPRSVDCEPHGCFNAHQGWPNIKRRLTTGQSSFDLNEATLVA